MTPETFRRIGAEIARLAGELYAAGSHRADGADGPPVATVALPQAIDPRARRLDALKRVLRAARVVRPPAAAAAARRLETGSARPGVASRRAAGDGPGSGPAAPTRRPRRERRAGGTAAPSPPAAEDGHAAARS
jgi:hypothetical protein